jgi:hypothetical protein
MEERNLNLKEKTNGTVKITNSRRRRKGWNTNLFDLLKVSSNL